MRPFVTVLLAVGALVQVPICHFASAEGEPTVVDGIAAVVNGEVITYSQVRSLSAPQERLLRQQYTGEELAKKLTELRQLSVKDLVDRRLVIQAFKKESFEIPDHIVDQRINQIIHDDEDASGWKQRVIKRGRGDVKKVLKWRGSLLSQRLAAQ